MLRIINHIILNSTHYYSHTCVPLKLKRKPINASQVFFINVSFEIQDCIVTQVQTIRLATNKINKKTNMWSLKNVKYFEKMIGKQTSFT